MTEGGVRFSPFDFAQGENRISADAVFTEIAVFAVLKSALSAPKTRSRK